MLKPAQLYSGELKTLHCEISYDPKYMFYFEGYADEYKPTTNTWSQHEFASVNKNDDVLGYIKYTIDRYSNNTYGFCCVNFSDDSLTFGIDLAQSIDDIFVKYQFRKLNFGVFCGNPAEKSYDKMCERYGGRIIGIKKEQSVLLDGNCYDYKMYEIMRDDYMNNRRVR